MWQADPSGLIQKNLAESSKEGYGSKWVVLPMMMVMMMIKLHRPTYLYILSRVLVTIGWVVDWMILFIDSLYIHTVRTYRQYSAIAILHTLHLAVTHALGYSSLH
jgi:hypothetical protein